MSIQQQQEIKELRERVMRLEAAVESLLTPKDAPADVRATLPPLTLKRGDRGKAV